MRQAQHLFLALALVGGLAGIGPARAEVAPARLALFDGWAEEDGSRVVAIAIDLDPGWKTYWRAPGEAGIPPAFDWDASENLSRVEFHWPVPSLFDSFGLRTIGYEQELVLPVRIWPEDPARPSVLRVDVDYGVCSDICLPARGDAELAVAPAAPAGPAAPVIAASMAQRPDRPDEAGVTGTRCILTPGPDPDVMDLTVRIHFDDAGTAGARMPEMLVVETPDENLWIDTGAPRQEGEELVVDATVNYFGPLPLVVDRSGLRLTLLGNGQAVEIEGCSSGR